jgi:uncharacterized beta-barrel protein YwiB (DUF1934 family)
MKKVLIAIKGYQQLPDSDEECIELITTGEYAFADGRVEFWYNETEITGLEGTTTTFTVDDELIVMNREGTVNTQMIYQEGRKHNFMYETPYGTMLMGVDTQKIVRGLDADGGRLEIYYVLDMNNTIVSRNKFKIYIRSETTDGQG